MRILIKNITERDRCKKSDTAFADGNKDHGLWNTRSERDRILQEEKKNQRRGRERLGKNRHMHYLLVIRHRQVART